MQHYDKVKAIQEIRPDAEFVLTENELKWLDKNQTQPTEKEILEGFELYQQRLQQEKKWAEEKKLIAEAKLAELGLTLDDLKALSLG